ncbi:MAG: hypothetical protein JKY55_18495 [Aliivibrio sp.]|uniref:hypothetical protein n=1 Tax=Aliivibrio sp. TaxID=1872443 RepID=UPI001A37E832|nr:hypothetical protein [Aliivibrio sp.]
MIPKFNALFIGLGTLLLVSMISNCFLYQEMVSKSKLLIQSEQTEQLAIDKNASLSSVIESMQSEQIASQLIADNLQQEVFELNQLSEKVRIVIKETIRNEPCYSKPISYPYTLGMHYN